MDKRIFIIAALAVLAVILTIVRESNSKNEESFSFMPSSKHEISGERISSMADTTLRALGIKKENIRPIKNRNDIRILYPVNFDVLKFISAIKDSLEEYNANVFSVDNAKEKVSIVQIKTGDTILKSFIFSAKHPSDKEPVTSAKPKAYAPQAQKKGVSPLVKKQTK